MSTDVYAGIAAVIPVTIIVLSPSFTHDMDAPITVDVQAMVVGKVRLVDGQKYLILESTTISATLVNVIV